MLDLIKEQNMVEAILILRPGFVPGCVGQVSEQTDTLRVLGTDPVDYLVTPRVIACCLALPILTLLCFTVGMAASVLLADTVYNVSSNIILDSAARALQVGRGGPGLTPTKTHFSSRSEVLRF